MLYPWIWKHLPGPSWARVTIVVLSVAIVTLSLFQWGFPALSHALPFLDQTVDEG